MYVFTQEWIFGQKWEFCRNVHHAGQLLNSRLSSLSRLLKIAVKVKGSSYPPIAGNWEALLLEVKWGKLRRIFAASVKIACYFHDHHHYYQDQTQPKKHCSPPSFFNYKLQPHIQKKNTKIRKNQKKIAKVCLHFN